ncbi:hypothetical protein J4N45_21150 [Vibrio sp. SCSIO 43140]|uniref:MaoC family dehydratase n=1 Tax=Vibrio sp. SCSIO 43140 TaxID=2819100 RepID=UPI00207533AB|nr:MaoC/PaaZ C-terminal domain-containing protein [Vibrio sp. SCSIO 43140]USD63489.1 hypothetical protein J4N45_21150 [Vibrio sp. SCSIO 43140]
MHITDSSSVQYRSLLLKALFKRPKIKGSIQTASSVTLTNPSFFIDGRALNRYCQHFGFEPSHIPLTYLFVATQGELLQLFVHPETAVRPLGLVHTFVEFEMFQQLEAEQNYHFTVALEMVEKTEKGQRFETVGEFSLEGQVIARYRSGYLMPNRGVKSKKRQSAPVEDLSAYHISTTLETSKKHTKAYAKVSGDYNPIHLNGLMARLFGFKAPIVHGMDMAARLLNVASNEINTGLIKKCRFDFKRPVFVDQTLKVCSNETQLLLVNEDNKSCVAMSLLERELSSLWL